MSNLCSFVYYMANLLSSKGDTLSSAYFRTAYAVYTVCLKITPSVSNFSLPLQIRYSVTPMRAASPPRQIESKNEMIVISYHLLCRKIGLSGEGGRLKAARGGSVFPKYRGSGRSPMEPSKPTEPPTKKRPVAEGVFSIPISSFLL